MENNKMTKTKKALFSTAFSFLANLSGVLSLLEMVLNKTKIDKMTTTEAIIKIVSIILTICICYYFLDELYKLKKDSAEIKNNAIKYVDNDYKNLQDEMSVLDTIHQRREVYLYDCIKALYNAQPLPNEPNWLTDLEIEQHQKIIDNNQKISDEIKRHFNIPLN